MINREYREHELRRVKDGRERAAMDRRGAERAQRSEVLGRAVALVLREPVAGKTRVVLAHHPVARHLGQDRSGRDTEALAVATDDRGLRMLEARDPASVDQHVAGSASRPASARRLASRVAQ